MHDIRKQFKEYLKKNELNFCSKAIYQIAENLNQFTNEEKMYIIYELSEFEDGQLIHDVISDFGGQASQEIQFELLNTDELHHIWEVTDNYLMIKKKNEE